MSFITNSSSINDGSSQNQIAAQSALQVAEVAIPKKADAVVLSKEVPALLQSSYQNSFAALDSSSDSISQDDIAQTALLGKQTEALFVDSNANGAANNTQSSQVLAAWEKALVYEDNLNKEYYDAGAPHQDVTSDYQQAASGSEVVNASLLQVSYTALQSTSNPLGTLESDLPEGGARASTLPEQIANAGKGFSTLLSSLSSPRDKTQLLLAHVTTLQNRSVNTTYSNLDSSKNIQALKDILEEVQSKKETTSTTSTTTTTSTSTYSSSEALNDLKSSLQGVENTNLKNTINEEDAEGTERKNSRINEEESRTVSRGQSQPLKKQVVNTSEASSEPLLGGSPGLAAASIQTNNATALSSGFGVTANLNLISTVSQNNGASLQQDLKSSINTLKELSRAVPKPPINASNL